MSASAPASATSAPDVPAWRRLVWSVRRELWENRSVCLAPPIVAGMFLAGFAVSLVGLPDRMRAAEALGPMERAEVVQTPYVMVAMILMAVGLVVGAVYSLDALYGERRDRSVLFWKSMPVRDSTTVLAKAIVPVLVVPFVTFAVTVGTQVVMLLGSAAVLTAAGAGTQVLRADLPILRFASTNLAHLVGFHGIGYAPLYAWFLLSSAWAKRAPLLWAAVPPAVVIGVERVALGTTRFADALRRHLGAWDAGEPTGRLTMDVLGGPSLAPVLSRPGTWVGLAIAALFLGAAIRLRRARGPI